MDAQFWLERWQAGAIGFHLTRVTPLLVKHWPSLGLANDARILVPLCGKSLDMVWLAAQGHRVLGVELAPLAIEQFFSEQNLQPDTHESPLGLHHVAGNIEIILGDIFDLDAATLESCSGVYDRGALVALPPAMRERYARHVYGALAPGYQGLVLTLDYDQSLMEGPPFSVPETEIRTLFSPHANVSLAGHMDIIDKEPKFAQRGLTSLESVVWHLEGKGVTA